MASQEQHSGQAQGAHPTPFTYLIVAISLSVITAVEVGVFYITELGRGIIPVLAVLSGLKFALVAMFYMHLRYEAKLFTTLFFTGVALAVAVVVVRVVLVVVDLGLQPLHHLPHEIGHRNRLGRE